MIKILNFNLVGNIFAVEKHIGRKTIITTVFSTIFMIILTFIFEQKIFSISGFMYSLIVASLFYGFFNRKYIIIFFKYLSLEKIGFMGFIYTFLEILLAVGIVIVNRGVLYSYILAIFWLFSGLQRVIIQKTRALFVSDIDEFMKFIKIYGYFRASYFAALIIIILNSSSPFLPTFSIFWILFFSVALLFNFWYIVNLWPYMKSHDEIKDMITIIRIAGNQNIIKVKKMPHIPNLENKIRKLSNVNYLKTYNGRIQLQNEYRNIRENIY